MDWAQILVILLSVLFAIFLVIVTALAILLLKLTKQIKATTASAERTVEALEESVTIFNKAALPAMLTKRLVSQLVQRSKKVRKNTDE